MRLVSIEIQGFKSFANRTHLTFGPGVTGVIGPNGSGKSNVAEAIRWVLGEQSMKALRGKDRADVLYSSETKHAHKAEVTLTFENEPGRFPLPVSEVAISRLLTREGDSQYSINNEPVRLIDLQQMLAEAGIGAKSYTVISQGMIDQYLTTSPEGRRELFDEATGIKSLQIKIVQSMQKLKKSQEHAQEVQAILDELSPRLTFLQRQIDRYNKADEYIAIYTQKQLAYFHTSWHSAVRHIIETNERIQAVQQRITTAKTNRIQAEKRALESASHRTPYTALEQELVSERARYTLSLEQYNRIENEKQTITESLRQIVQQKNELLKTIPLDDADATQGDIRATLRACKDFLDQVVHDIIPPKTVADRLLRAVSSHLANTKPSNTESPRVLLARLVAIEEERTNQLQRLPSTVKPSSSELKRLQAQLDALGIDSAMEANAGVDTEQAREAELHAERDGVSLSSLLAQQEQALHALEQEIKRECGSSAFASIQASSDTQQETVTEDELRTLASKIASIGERDDLIAGEHAEAMQRFTLLTTQLADVEATISRIQEGIHEVSNTIAKSFDQKFAVIAQHFSTYFTELFHGGSAELHASEEGIEISVIPPGKRKRHITLLSGGERALTSIALLFAILDAQQPPFIVLDEVDAALDEANSHRFAQLLRNHATKTQSIVISHNRETMSQSDLLYGVTMDPKGISTVYSVKVLD